MDVQGRVTAAEVRLALRAVYHKDRETNLQKALFHALRDDLRPVSEKGRWKANPLLLLWAVLALAAVGVFVYFSLG